ncbi:MAG: AGE family epimerase/isomerase [Candidatus Latescibacterota bacterium]
MKRRLFLGTAGTAALTSGVGGAGSAAAAPAPRTTGPDGKIGDMTLAAIRDQFRSEFDEFVTFFDQYVVDTQYGGFLCSTNHDGTHMNENKTASTEGRGIWCYSFMYNNGLVKDKKYLDYARKSIDFIMKHKPSGTDYWPSSWSREGKVLDPKGGLPGDCYIAEGLAEYSRATGDAQIESIARETMQKCLAHYDRPDFKDGSTPYPGARNQWYWMLFMWFGTNWLKKKPDPELLKIVDRCKDALIIDHMHPDFQLMNLVINHDNTRASGENEKHARVAGCGHATEATWMILYEAARRKDRKLFDRTAEIFRRHVEVSKDDVYGGVYNDCEDVDANQWQLSKIFWAQAFVLIGSLQVIEHTGADWAREMFAQQFDYIEKKCRLKRWGLPLMIDSGDRKLSALPKASRKDIYHHPRYLMLCLLTLERMVQKGGKVSGVFV